MKTCKWCLRTRPLERFGREKYKNGFFTRTKCKDCRNSDARKLPSRTGPGLRSKYLKYYYGITPAIYNQMLEGQSGVCKICFGDADGVHKRLAVDHCHITGRVRGLLCHKCNKGLGQFLDNPLLLRLAAEYSERA